MARSVRLLKSKGRSLGEINRIETLVHADCRGHQVANALVVNRREIDFDQPRYEELSKLSKFRHYTGLKEFPNTIRGFLGEFGSARLDEVYSVKR